MFGSIPLIFPEPLQDALRYFDSRCSSSKHRSQFPIILVFTQRYKIHWISMWNYTINSNLLDREFSVKWWDSLKIEKIINQVYKDYPPSVQKPIALRTRSQSSLYSVQITGKSSKEGIGTAADSSFTTARIRRTGFSYCLWRISQPWPSWSVPRFPRSLQWV